MATVNGKEFSVYGGKYGHRFLDIDRIDGNKWNATLVERIVHWEPRHCVLAIEFAGMSINNLKQIKRAMLSRSSEPLDLIMPTDEATDIFVNDRISKQGAITLRRRTVSYANPLPAREDIESVLGPIPLQNDDSKKQAP